MPTVSLDGLSFSGLSWTFKLPPSTQTPVYDMLRHLPVHFSHQHMVSLEDKGKHFSVTEINVLPSETFFTFCEAKQQ
jgi:hypothetical protein